MAAGRFSRNTVLAGVFVLVAVALFVTAVVLLSESGSWVRNGTEYSIRFDLDEGADGLEKGSAVKLGGKKIGSVLGVDFDPQPGGDQEVRSLVVRIKVDGRIKLYNDAQVTLVRPLLGSNSALNIVKLRSKPDAKLVSPGGEINGDLAPPGFVSQADYAKVQKIIDDAQAFSGRINRWSEIIDPTFDQNYGKIEQTITDVSEMVKNARASWSDWRTWITDTIKLVRDRADSIITGIDDGIKEVRQTVADIDKAVDENRPYVREITENAASVVKQFRIEDYARVTAAIKDAQESMAKIRDFSAQANEMLTTRRPDIEQIITQAALAADQLKLTMVEVRAAPWRVLYQPNKKELENELLYNTIRQYSESLAETRAAAQALEAAARSLATTPAGATPAVDQATLDELTLKLKTSLSRSQERERKFFERWIGESSK
jgi:ABC-type transporter Mla subunit MlaD